ncbi:hypothetical protein DUNSADRAFT_14982 [Dunaliella salina]|uniref:FAS1 domain-containing protein n=1 Tax=Dunaliella salina TaxID=3046 RepID=A0ABQ7H270_DUNSA|nr:hypothetical protein DUNSADRAFT_14982 [Dunaliella salina]|eukprot:KAF5840958.1 hypothetical protein DUNSADRAFT_14982 [Dunaliella salina]
MQLVHPFSNPSTLQNLRFGQSEVCNNKGNTTIDPTETLVLKPQSEQEPSNGAEAYPGEPKYQKVPENKPVLEILQDLGIYKTFLEALKSSGLAEQLGGANDPDYPGPPPKPTGPEQEIVPEFPWWFGFSIDRSKLPPPPPPPALPPPPPPGIPELGPYTVLAPTDEAFDILLLQLGGGRPLPKSTLLALPELKDILQYHVLPGMYATGNMYNNTPIWTARSVGVTPFTDPCMTEGRVMLHDGCVDKPTPDTFSCEVVQPDFRASNGIVQGISRVLFPPPAFNKSMYIGAEGVDPKLQEALASDKPIEIEQGDAPGAIPGRAGPVDPAATGKFTEDAERVEPNVAAEGAEPEEGQQRREGDKRNREGSGTGTGQQQGNGGVNGVSLPGVRQQSGP